MTIEKALRILYEKTQELYPEAVRWHASLCLDSRISGYGISKEYSVNLMGFSEQDVESFHKRCKSLKEVFDVVNREIDKLPEKLKLEID
jgi:hypothetical protein